MVVEGVVVEVIVVEGVGVVVEELVVEVWGLYEGLLVSSGLPTVPMREWQYLMRMLTMLLVIISLPLAPLRWIPS